MRFNVQRSGIAATIAEDVDEHPKFLFFEKKLFYTCMQVFCESTSGAKHILSSGASAKLTCEKLAEHAVT